jgi:hypothetical protein
MKFRLIIFLILFSSKVFSQEKYALLFSATNNKEGTEKIKARKNTDIISTALLAQGFKPGNISADTTVPPKKVFFHY